MIFVSRISSLLSLIALFGVCVAFGAETSGSIDPERISQSVKVLASDEFEGRAPGTPGETKTIEWLSQSLRRVGPRARRRTWELDAERYPLVRTQIDSPATLSFAIQGKSSAR